MQNSVMGNNENIAKSKVKLTQKKDKLSHKKKGWKVFKTLFFSAFLMIMIVCVGGIVFYFTTRENQEEYIPSNFIAYARIDSISELFESMMNLQAAKYVIANESVASFYNLYNTLKSNEILNSFAGKWLLDVDTSLILDQENRVSVVIDMGIRSLATQMVAVIERLEVVEGLKIAYQTQNYKIFSYEMKDQSPLYLSIKNNLVFISPQKEALIDLYRNASGGSTLKDLDQLGELKAQAHSNGMVDFYLRTNRIIDQLGGKNVILKKMMKNVEIGDIALISISLTNDKFDIEVISEFGVMGKEGERSEIAKILNKIIEFNPLHTGVQRLLPSDVSAVTSFRFKDFKELYKLFFYLNGGDYKSKSRDIDALLKVALFQNSDELIFDWMGNEAGVFMLKQIADPIIFIHMKDPALQRQVFSELNKSLFLNLDLATRVDGVSLGKISFPDGLMPLLNLFRRGLDAPFYVAKEGYLFLSLNGEALAHVVNSYRDKNLLVRDKKFQLSRGNSSKSNIFAYYNVNQGLPRFIEKKTLIGSILNLYAKGIFCFDFDDDYLRLTANASGEVVKSERIYPGYPRIVSGGIASWVETKNVVGNAAEEFLYIDKGQNLVVMDASFNRYTMPVMKDSHIVSVGKAKSTRIYVSGQKGSLYCCNGKGESIDPFPIETGFINSFTPVAIKEGLLYFSKKEKALYIINSEGLESKINYSFSQDVFYPPAVMDDLIAVYPRSLTGQVYLINKAGDLQEGWPVIGGGISQAGAVFVKESSNKRRVVFLTQAGKLSCWDMAGDVIPGFPINLTGIFHAAAVAMRLADGREALALLSEAGQLYIVSMGGIVLQSQSILQASGESSRLLVHDVDGSGDDELFIYGDFNYIIGLDSGLDALKGFPVKGSGAPTFSDLDFNGREELVCSLLDKDGKDKIFAYYVNK